MKMQAFVDLLNSSNTETVWVQDTNNINNGYPIFKWQITGSETTQIWVANSDNTEFTYGSGETAIMVKIGDYIDYTPDTETIESKGGTTYETGTRAEAPTLLDEGNGYGTQEFSTTNYSSGWRVLGVESGNLQLISADSIGTLTLCGYTGATYGTKELNKICSKFAKSGYTNSARSVTVDDINKITGYNPSTANYGKGSMVEYGNEVTYKWGESSSSVTYTYGANKTEGSYTSTNYGIYGFNYITNTGNWISSKFTKAGENITTLKSTYYCYYPNTLSPSQSGNTVGIEVGTDAKAYQTLFCDSNKAVTSFWLASPYIVTQADSVLFGIRYVNNGYVGGSSWIISTGFLTGYGFGVRPVITIKSNITINKDGKTGESQEEAYKLVLLAE
jgi:hypothetical protein